MKAHELARQLLAGPDVDVVMSYDDVPEYANGVTDVKLEARTSPYDGPNVECVTLYYSNDGDVWEKI